jgi:hypothetical protein
LIAYYPFNGNANDLRGGFNGTPKGITSEGPTPTFDRCGNPGAAYLFDGDDYVEIEDNGSLSFDVRSIDEGDFTVSLWFRLDTSEEGQFNLIIDRSTENGQSAYDIKVNSENFETPRVNAAWWDRREVSFPGVLSAPCSVVPNLPDHQHPDRWHHIAYVARDGCISLFFDGEYSVDSDCFPPSASTQNEDGTTIGAFADGGRKHFFKGAIDDVAIYKRALSPEEIAEVVGGCHECIVEGCCEGEYDEAGVRSRLADANRGLIDGMNVINFYRQFDDPNSKETVCRWNADVRVRNITKFDRKIVGDCGNLVVYDGTDARIDGCHVCLTSDPPECLTSDPEMTATPTAIPTLTATGTATRTPTPPPSPTVEVCVGDCGGDGISIDELIRCVNAALGRPAIPCAACDPDGDGIVQIDELIGAVDSALNGCPSF